MLIVFKILIKLYTKPALDPRSASSNPGEVDGCFRGIKVLSTLPKVQNNIIHEIEERELVLNGYVRRIGEERLRKKALKWNPPGRKKRRRHGGMEYYKT